MRTPAATRYSQRPWGQDDVLAGLAVDLTAVRGVTMAGFTSVLRADDGTQITENQLQGLPGLPVYLAVGHDWSWDGQWGNRRHHQRQRVPARVVPGHQLAARPG